MPLALFDDAHRAAWRLVTAPAGGPGARRVRRRARCALATTSAPASAPRTRVANEPSPLGAPLALSCASTATRTARRCARRFVDRYGDRETVTFARAIDFSGTRRLTREDPARARAAARAAHVLRGRHARQPAGHRRRHARRARLHGDRARQRLCDAAAGGRSRTPRPTDSRARPAPRARPSAAQRAAARRTARCPRRAPRPAARRRSPARDTCRASRARECPPTATVCRTARQRDAERPARVVGDGHDRARGGSRGTAPPACWNFCRSLRREVERAHDAVPRRRREGVERHVERADALALAEQQHRREERRVRRLGDREVRAALVVRLDVRRRPRLEVDAATRPAARARRPAERDLGAVAAAQRHAARAARDRLRVGRREERRRAERRDRRHRARRADHARRYRVRAVPRPSPATVTTAAPAHREQQTPADRAVARRAARRSRTRARRPARSRARARTARCGRAASTDTTSCASDERDREQPRPPAPRRARAHFAASAGATAARICSSVIGPSIPRTMWPSRPTIDAGRQPDRRVGAAVLLLLVDQDRKRHAALARERPRDRGRLALVDAEHARPCPAFSRAKRCSAGISSRHGGHHVAQMLSSTTWPRWRASESVRPSVAANVERLRGRAGQRGRAAAAARGPGRGRCSTRSGTAPTR